MNALLLFSLLALPSALDRDVTHAVQSALKAPGARAAVTVERVRLPASCTVDQVVPPLAYGASARMVVDLVGQDRRGQECRGTAWVSVHVRAPVWVLGQDVNVGDDLQAAAALQERELAAGQPPWREPLAGLAASRRLSRGTVLEARHLQAPGPAPGEPIKVVATVGAVRIEQVGRVAACPGLRTCAALPGGRRVEGRLVQGELVVEVP